MLQAIDEYDGLSKETKKIAKKMKLVLREKNLRNQEKAIAKF